MNEASDKALAETSARRPEQGITIQDASAWVLRVGVATSVAMMLTGLAISFARHHAPLERMEEARLDPRPAALWAGLRQLRGQAIIELGIYLLVLTPIMRVFTSTVIFALVEKDWLYTAVTLVVLALTLIGLLWL